MLWDGDMYGAFISTQLPLRKRYKHLIQGLCLAEGIAVAKKEVAMFSIQAVLRSVKTALERANIFVLLHRDSNV